MAKKELKGIVKIVAPAKQANPSPPLGPALGAAGVNIAEFCKQFNEKTSDKDPGTPIPCIIKVYTDRSFEFTMKLPPVSYLIKKALKIKLGSKKPGRDFIGTLKEEEIKKIATEKMPDLNCSSVDSAIKIISGQCKSMGVKVEA